MSRVLALLLALASPAVAQDAICGNCSLTTLPSKSWTALIVWTDGKVYVVENIQQEKVCREALCGAKYGMSCADKERADAEAKLAQEKRQREYEERVAQYRITHPCKVGDDKLLHCPMPDGGERVYDTEGNLKYGYSGTSTSYVISGTPVASVKYAACFQP